jgi:glyoxylase-like metal-dependent hydrolase (beta-lactamase superfamily II)
MFGLIPKTMWATWTAPDALNRIGLAMNCVLLERHTPHVERILIETGAGGKWPPKSVQEYEFAQEPDGTVRTIEHALAEVGVPCESITNVVVTHLHFDHAGGLTRLGGDTRPELTFPNAHIHVQRQEWQDALANRSTMTRTYLRTHLDPIADRVVLHDGHVEVLPGVLVRPLVGHTWGQQGVLWNDHQGTLCFPGDLLPTVHHSHPASSLGYDMLPYETMLTKRALLAEAQEKHWRLVLDHEPGPCVVTVRDGRLVPLE